MINWIKRCTLVVISALALFAGLFFGANIFTRDVAAAAEIYSQTDTEKVFEAQVDEGIQEYASQAAKDIEIDLVDNAVYELNDVIRRANEVRVSLQRQIEIVTNTNNILGRPGSQARQDRFADDVAWHASIIDAIANADFQRDNALSTNDSDEVIVSALQNLSAELIDVIERWGPYPNENNIPEQWLRDNLPNGDPRNLPSGVAETGIGPESINIWQSQNNNQTNAMFVQLFCTGPDSDEPRNVDRNEFRNRRREVHGYDDIPDRSLCQWPIFSFGGVETGQSTNLVLNSEANAFEPDRRLFETNNVFTLMNFMCASVSFDNSNTFQNTVNLERDEDGYIVFRRLNDPCVLGLTGTSVTELGFRGSWLRSWDFAPNFMSPEGSRVNAPLHYQDVMAIINARDAAKG